jgi:uncharacterized DUF497 family protein
MPVRVRFGWDARKSDRNLRERGFDFAAQIFDGITAERTDTRPDFGERRVVTLGEAQGIPLTVVCTDRAGGGGVGRRIISARKSNRRERKAYAEAIRKHESGQTGPR